MGLVAERGSVVAQCQLEPQNPTGIHAPHGPHTDSLQLAASQSASAATDTAPLAAIIARSSRCAPCCRPSCSTNLAPAGGRRERTANPPQPAHRRRRRRRPPPGSLAGTRTSPAGAMGGLPHTPHRLRTACLINLAAVLERCDEQARSCWGCAATTRRRRQPPACEAVPLLLPLFQPPHAPTMPPCAGRRCCRRCTASLRPPGAPRPRSWATSPWPGEQLAPPPAGGTQRRATAPCSVLECSCAPCAPSAAGRWCRR